jgi:hypothetical protein
MRKSTMRKTLATGALSAVAAATLTTLTTLPAEAAAPPAGTCRLAISYFDKYRHQVFNYCTPRSPADRQTQYIIWEEDWPDGDDFIRDRRVGRPVDLFTIENIYLDRDNFSKDEIYTENRFVRPNGTTYGIKSNEVHKEFSSLF